MPDREKVIKELSELHGSKETMEIIEQAIALLKEQDNIREAKLVDNIEIHVFDTVGDCPWCGIGVSKRYHPMNCGLCGQAVKWDE